VLFRSIVCFLKDRNVDGSEPADGFRLGHCSC
jgi:hypothetical protein